MKAIKNIGLSIAGLAFLLAALSLPFIFIHGAVWVSERVLPLMQNVIVYAVLACILMIPLALIPSTRAWAAIGYTIASYVFGAATWMFGLLITYELWGGVAVFIGLCFVGVGVVPMGIVAAAIDGYWPVVGSLALGLGMTFGARMLSAFLLASAERRAERIANDAMLQPLVER